MKIVHSCAVRKHHLIMISASQTIVKDRSGEGGRVEGRALLPLFIVLIGICSQAELPPPLPPPTPHSTEVLCLEHLWGKPTPIEFLLIGILIRQRTSISHR